MSKRLLFLSHQASRTGAPFVLLHFLRWLKENSDWTWEVAFREGGELLPEFAALSPITVWERERVVPSRLTRLKKRALRDLGHVEPDEWHDAHALELARQTVDKGAALVYSNTLTNGPLLNALAGLNCPVICHAHEMEYTIERRLGIEKFEMSDARTDHYIAASGAVKRSLMSHHQVPDEKIDVVHEFVPTQSLNAQHMARARQEIRRELGIPSEAPVVIGSGTLDWRKGPDLWVQMAAQVARRTSSRAHFIWVGATTGVAPEAPFELNYDVVQAGLADRVHFVGERANVLEYFAASDVFAMTSREDPYPLVNLEAASVGRPIVCFQNAGGTPEFVEEDCGYSVPYLDVSQMASRIGELLESSELRQQMGARAARKVRERHDVAHSAPQILAIIERCLSHAS